ncbi:hypothetical protein BD779DRAFT_485550 [Infundibulicybe gibba]|nr:hypothetical protein BD779DRAFT_485550 [Infundibulicybe gibba]
MFKPFQLAPPRDPNGRESPDKRPLPFGWFAHYSKEIYIAQNHADRIYVNSILTPPKISHQHPADIAPAVSEYKETPRPNEGTVKEAVPSLVSGGLYLPKLESTHEISHKESSLDGTTLYPAAPTFTFTELKYPGFALHRFLSTRDTPSERTDKNSTSTQSAAPSVQWSQSEQPSKSDHPPPQDHPSQPSRKHRGKEKGSACSSPPMGPRPAEPSSSVGYYFPSPSTSRYHPSNPGGVPVPQSYYTPTPSSSQPSEPTKVRGAGTEALKKIASTQGVGIVTNLLGGGVGALTNGIAGMSGGGLGAPSALAASFDSFPSPGIGTGHTQFGAGGPSPLMAGKPYHDLASAYQKQAYSLMQASMQHQQQTANMLGVLAQQQQAMAIHNAAQSDVLGALIAAQKQQQQATMSALAAVGRQAGGYAGSQAAHMQALMGMPGGTTTSTFDPTSGLFNSDQQSG